MLTLTTTGVLLALAAASYAADRPKLAGLLLMLASSWLTVMMLASLSLAEFTLVIVGLVFAAYLIHTALGR